MSDNFKSWNDSIRDAIVEICELLAFIADKQEQIKEIKQTIKEEYGLTPKQINQLTKMYYDPVKHGIVPITQEVDELIELYEKVFKGDSQ